MFSKLGSTSNLNPMNVSSERNVEVEVEGEEVEVEVEAIWNSR